MKKTTLNLDVLYIYTCIMYKFQVTIFYVLRETRYKINFFTFYQKYCLFFKEMINVEIKFFYWLPCLTNVNTTYINFYTILIKQMCMCESKISLKWYIKLKYISYIHFIISWMINKTGHLQMYSHLKKVIIRQYNFVTCHFKK